MVEYDAVRFFILVSDTIRRLLSGFKNPQMIKALSMVSASGNTVLLDNEMLPLRKAINWTDKRFAYEADIVLEKPDYRRIYETTGWPFNNTFPLAHLSWLKLNEPEILKSAYKICMVTDYVNYRLTGNLCTNPSTATTFYLADQAKGIWLDEILDKLGIDKEKLPEILPANAVMGNITAKAAEETGLMENTPVIAGSFDHPGAARATGVLEEGGVLLSCGTSWVGFYPSNRRETLVSLEMLVDPFLKDMGIWGGMFSGGGSSESPRSPQPETTQTIISTKYGQSILIKRFMLPPFIQTSVVTERINHYKINCVSRYGHFL